MNIKEKIINETMKLFSKKGYMSTSINDILTITGTSKGGLYNHFKSKEELFKAVLDHSGEIWRIRNFEGLKEIDSPIKKLIRFLENYRDRYLVDSINFPGGCIYINLSVELDDQNPKLSKIISKGFIGLKNIIKNLLKESKKRGEIKNGIHTNDIAEIIFSAALGASITYGQDKSATNLNRTINALIAYIKEIIV